MKLLSQGSKELFAGMDRNSKPCNEVKCLLHVQCWRPPECDVVARDDDGIKAVRNALTYEVSPSF